MRTFFVAAVLSASVDAFWGTGHLLVSRQAQAILADEAPDALSAALSELATLKKYYPDLTEDEGNNPFTECATFADDIKGKGYSWQSDWHFVDQPYLDQGGSLDDYDFTESTYDVVDALN